MGSSINELCLILKYDTGLFPANKPKLGDFDEMSETATRLTDMDSGGMT
ncbi:MAG: hypothetical protein ACI9GW_001175 [Halieaceae bacterium]|jgi:hypothetical protein